MVVDVGGWEGFRSGSGARGCQSGLFAAEVIFTRLQILCWGLGRASCVRIVSAVTYLHLLPRKHETILAQHTVSGCSRPGIRCQSGVAEKPRETPTSCIQSLETRDATHCTRVCVVRVVRVATTNAAAPAFCCFWRGEGGFRSRSGARAVYSRRK